MRLIRYRSRYMNQLKAEQAQLLSDISDLKAEVDAFVVLGDLKQTSSRWGWLLRHSQLCPRGSVAAVSKCPSRLAAFLSAAVRPVPHLVPHFVPHLVPTTGGPTTSPFTPSHSSAHMVLRDVVALPEPPHTFHTQVDERLTAVLDIEARLEKLAGLAELYQARETIFQLPTTEYPQIEVWKNNGRQGL
eukprot:363603-Chlamydomonas_euryale.AAC.4